LNPKTSFETLKTNFEALKMGFEVGYDETHDWGGWQATPDQVGVVANQRRSECGDRQHCSPVWRFVGHGFAMKGRGV
jgi:hypothetical protein